MAVAATCLLAALPQCAVSQKAPAEYVGSETCQGCHEDLFGPFKKSPHQRIETDKRRGWEGRACESCHGPGGKHAESTAAADILNPARLAPAAADRGCLKCHLNQSTRVGRLQGGHARSQVACVACHSIHQSSPRLAPARAAVNRACAACHTSAWAEFQRPHRHRLPEGAMSCVDCHNPHGAFLPGSLRTVAANEPGCFKCHADKRGPFAFEHPPARLQGCRTCHEPHGSANPRMLIRHEQRFLCLECHSNFGTLTGNAGSPAPAFHDLASSRYRNCTICHTKIHGSYVDRALRR